MSDLQQPGQTPISFQRAYHLLVHDLTTRLPLPEPNTQAAIALRNEAALAQIADMLPVNANETALAVQCVATRAQADHVQRQFLTHAGDIQLEIKLNAQYNAMVRASLAAHGHLLRAQAQRHKRDADGSAREADEWTRYIATSSAQRVLDGEPPPITPEPAPPLPPAAEPPAAAVAAAPASRPRRRSPDRAADDELQFDWDAEAEHYAAVYPRRARLIRELGGLPDNCDFGPPEPPLVRALVRGNSPALRALDAPEHAAAD